MPNTIVQHRAVDAITAALRRLRWRALPLGADGRVPARTYEARKSGADVLDVDATGERYRLCKQYLCSIENRDDILIGGVRLGVEMASRHAYAVKEIQHKPQAARALRHLQDEQQMGVQAGSDVAGRTLLRSPSRNYLLIPLMAGDLTSLRDTHGRGRTAAMLLGMRAVLQDLQRMHARGVAHRDIKPANVLHRGTAASLRLCDFGLAQPIDRPGHGSGTPHHMAPEQHRARIGAIAGHDCAPADVWGVGATFVDIWVGNPFYCPRSAARSELHAAYARWHKSTDSVWGCSPGRPDTWGFAWAFMRLPAHVRPLMLKLLHPNARKRPTPTEALAQVEALLAQTGDLEYADAHYEAAAQAACSKWTFS